MRSQDSSCCRRRGWKKPKPSTGRPSLDDSSFAWDGLGLVLLRRDLRNEARRAFERAVTINDTNATAWVHLGLAYEFLGNGRAAVAADEKA